MPTNPFTNYNSNARFVAIPVVPGAVNNVTITAVGTVDRRIWTLSATNIANLRTDAYVHFIAMYGVKTAAASMIDITWQWQYFDGGGAAIGAASVILTASVGWNGAAAAGNAINVEYFPSFPHHLGFASPANPVTLRLQSVAANIVGAPTINCSVASGIDQVNGGPPGDIGGLGMVAQGANNPNTF